QLAQAGAPIAFGVVADTFGGRAGGGSGTGGGGLEYAFLIMLVPLALSGLIVWRARRTYPSDATSASGDQDAQPPAGRDAPSLREMCRRVLDSNWREGNDGG